ncbi:DNA-binding protein [Aneurinibacillus migulanus]|uniref:helix-turn-helix domain-containing protein n=1 Tax=Aneurinibacillus migulanus TaxID=47500 RepID=UPI0005B89369|nr:helix-turn-helix domain-containing protein [Aneurinibacillus migulanus]KIV59271.1 DNA-binding protein [Aneurinibacillus migulanus]KPD10092.1 DNA-binding protein [Aneurinibacillus migulanus]
MNQLDNYPEVLDVVHIQRILGIGRRQAYKLATSGSFHTVRIGSRIKISKTVFIKWLQGDNSYEHSANL